LTLKIFSGSPSHIISILIINPIVMINPIVIIDPKTNKPASDHS
jgi:hypothetical protein